MKDITHIDASGFVSKTNLAALKTEVDKIDTDKLKTVPDDLAKLTNVVKNEVVKKTDFSANDYVKKTKFSADTNALDDKSKSTELENKISDNSTKITGVKTDLNDYAKKSEVADDITKIKNDYVTNASLTSQLNDLKSQHIATEVKTIDDKTKRNAVNFIWAQCLLAITTCLV